MGSYVGRTLMTGEQITYEAKLSIWPFLPAIIIGLLLLPLFGLGLLIWLAVYLRYSSTELAITNKRVIAKFGFIRRQTVELNLKRIEGVQVDQGIIARIFDFGSLIISGTGSTHEPIPGISKPLAFRKAFAEALDAAA